MRHLPRTHRVLTMQVNSETSAEADEPRVLAVGRFVRPVCSDCGGFESVKVTVGTELITINCKCVRAASMGVAA